MIYAIPKVKVDQVLVGNAGVLRHYLEIPDNVCSHSDGDLLLELGGIGILPVFHFRQVIFGFHS